MVKIGELRNLGPLDEVNLKVAGVSRSEHLLESFSSKRALKKLAKTTGIDVKKLEAWVRQADFLRIKGVGPSYAGLLEATGLASASVLAELDSQGLLDKLIEANEEENLVGHLPGLGELEDWISQAKELEELVKL